MTIRDRGGRPDGRRRPRLTVAAAVMFALAAGGCSSSSARSNDTRTAGVYAAVLRQVVPPVTTDVSKNVVYVSPFPEQKSIALDTQAAVIAQLSKQATVRFVDELSEAVDAGTAGAPAKEGLVVLLGPVASIGSTVEVDAERYLSETDIVRLRFRVAATGTEWTANTVVTTGPTST